MPRSEAVPEDVRAAVLEMLRPFEDVQRDRVYAALELAEADSLVSDEWLSPSDLPEFVASALAAADMEADPQPSIELDVEPDDPLTGWCSASTRVIHLDPRLLSPWTVLHELAHWVDLRDGHGPRFCANLILLVEGTLGVEASDCLWAAFAEEEVQVDEDWLPASR